ncbi:MAG TPA: phage holin family protein [Acidimicrobiia bacterium]|nr:phage holin family protein [Acidimicrobiia bacterium]
MSSAKELPQLVTELTDLSKQYIMQETVEPAKRLGRVAGMGIGAGILFAFGAVFLGVALALVLVMILPEGDLWKSLAYFISTLLLAGSAGLIIWRATR